MVCKEEFEKIFLNPSENQDDRDEWAEKAHNNDFDPVEKYGNDVIFFENYFPSHKNIRWEDIINKIQSEYLNESIRFLHKGVNLVTENETENHIKKFDQVTITKEIDRLPTAVTHTTKFLSDLLKDSVIEAHEKMGVNFLHIYTSFIADSYLFDRHNDTMSVLIVSTIGQIEYAFDDGKSYLLNPGDGIYIPKGVYHKPKIFGPRSTFSYCWSYNK